MRARWQNRDTGVRIAAIAKRRDDGTTTARRRFTKAADATTTAVGAIAAAMDSH